MSQREGSTLTQLQNRVREERMSRGEPVLSGGYRAASGQEEPPPSQKDGEGFED